MFGRNPRFPFEAEKYETKSTGTDDIAQLIIGVRGGGQLSPKNLERTRFGQIAQVELGKINF